jgi:hypothetical protein
MPSLQLIAERHAEQSQDLAEKMTRAIWILWAGLSNTQWWSDTDVWAAAASSAMLLDTGLRTGRRQARAYATRAMLTAGVTAGRLVPVEDIYPRHGVTPIQVMLRLAKTYRWEVSQGRVETARAKARTRLEVMIGADLAAAQRRVERNTYASNSKVTGYRRIIHPELSRGGTCGLCIAAADRIYSLTELMPLHYRCNCLPAPITTNSDPGLILHKEDLAHLYSAAGSTDAKDLTKIRVFGTDRVDQVTRVAAAPVSSPVTGSGGSGGGLPPRHGMLGDMGEDEFPEINGYKPSIRRSQIDEFTEDDAYVILHGDGTGHGGHAWDSPDPDKTKFPIGWDEREVGEWVRALIDHPQRYQSQDNGAGFVVFGVARGVEGIVVVRQYTGFALIMTAHPLDMVKWPHG